MAVCVFVVDFVLRLVPTAGIALGQLLTPLLTCGLLFATHALARGEPARFGDLLAAFSAGTAAIAAIVVADLATFLFQCGGTWLATGADLLGEGTQDALDTTDVFTLFALGSLGSLPFTLVPFEALFARRGFAASFRRSFAAFAANVPALLVYALLSFLLAAVVVVTMGAAVVIVMPLWAASSYAAWLDLAPPAEG